jgi:hypothetical protein
MSSYPILLNYRSVVKYSLDLEILSRFFYINLLVHLAAFLRSTQTGWTVSKVKPYLSLFGGGTKY